MNSPRKQKNLPFPVFASKNAGFVLAGSTVAIFVSTIILWGMYQLIKAVDVVVAPKPPARVLDFVRLVRTPIEERIERTKPEKEPPNFEPPPIQNTWDFDSSNIQTAVLTPIKAPPIDHADGSVGFNSDSSNMELTLFAPMYPERARVRGIEGHCDVVFTITKTGSVKNAVVDQNNCTSRLFYGPSVKAALKFKYTPRYIDGEALETHNVSKRFTYTLE